MSKSAQLVRIPMRYRQCRRLVHEDAGVRGLRRAMVLPAVSRNGHGCCHTGHHGHHVVRDGLHGVVDSHAGGYPEPPGELSKMSAGVLQRKRQHLGANETALESRTSGRAEWRSIFVGNLRAPAAMGGYLGGAGTTPAAWERRWARHVAGHSSSSSLMGLRCVFAVTPGARGFHYTLPMVALPASLHVVRSPG